MIDYNPMLTTQHLKEGDYVGSISKVKYVEPKGYFIVEILMGSTIFNTCFSTKSVIFNNFAFNFTNEEGKLNENAMMYSIVKFSVVDKETTEGNVKSKVTSLEAVILEE